MHFEVTSFISSLVLIKSIIQLGDKVLYQHSRSIGCILISNEKLKSY